MKVLFLDRDGTLIHEPAGGIIDSLQKFKTLPFVTEALKNLQAFGYRLIMVSNQPGLGTEKFSMVDFSIPQNKLMNIFKKNNIVFEGTFFCPHYREDNCVCMKPKTGLIDGFIRSHEIDMQKSFTIGDRETDAILAQNIGCRSISYSKIPHKGAEYGSDNWNEITQYLLNLQ